MLKRTGHGHPERSEQIACSIKEVTSDTGRMTVAWACGAAPNAVEIDFFLSQYHFDADAVIEPIEISRDGMACSSSTYSQSRTASMMIYRCWRCGQNKRRRRMRIILFRTADSAVIRSGG